MKSNEGAADGRASGEAIGAFARLAECYCDLIDRQQELTAESLLHQVHVLLPRLYSAALALPDPDADDTEASDDVEDENDEEPLPENALGAGLGPDRMTHEQWEPVFKSLGKLLGPRDGYWSVFDPYITPPEHPTYPSLADDFADIYRDLMYGLKAFRCGMPDQAAWRWRLHFNVHWAAHVTTALHAIEALASMHGLGFPPKDTLRDH